MNFYERACKALNDATEEVDGEPVLVGRDSVAAIEAAMQEARDEAFVEAARIAKEEGGEHDGCDPCDACRIEKRLLGRRGSVSR